MVTTPTTGEITIIHMSPQGNKAGVKETVGGCPLIQKAQPSAQGREVERSQKCKFRNGEEDWMNTPITFPPIPSDDVSDEPLISETEVEGYLIRRVFLDQGAAVKVMFEHCFHNLWRIDLEVMFESEGLCRRTMMKFTVVQASSLYNIILGRTGIRELRAISSTTYAMMKFPTLRGIATCVPRTDTIFECRQLEGKQALPEEQPNEGAAKCRESSIEEEGMINTVFPDQKVTIGIRFSPACRLQLITLLKDNKDVFAWQPADMVGGPRRISQHSLNVNSSVTPVAQKRRVLGPKKSSVVIKEVGECIKAGIVRPVRYPTWISKPVLVKKVDDTWRMRIDFKNLNSTCPKDYHPLPEIDLKIEAVIGFPFKCFLDAYKGYHQIQMSKEDEEKTAFYTDQGTYCYTKMSFGLKNTGETYQRLVDSAFQTQLGRNLKEYVDDMVIKRKMERDMIMDIAKTFDNLRKVNMKFYPKKCSFWVKEGKFLCYMVMSEGIRANPKKTKAVADIQSPKTLKEMQSLSGKLAALNRFLSRSAGQQAFQKLKKLIMELSMLTTPGLKETLYVYLAASKEEVSEVLIADRKGKHVPVRYVNRTLHEAERNYAPLEKLALCLLYLSRRLRRKLAKYAVELGAYNITYIPQNAVKGQVLTDFLNEGVGAGLVLIDPTGIEYTYAIRLNFTSTNNEAEYEALLTGLWIAGKMKVQALKVKVDSKLVACQFNGEFVASSDGMAKYLAKKKELSTLFKKFSIENMPQNQNQKADVLSKLASVAFNHLTKEILVEVLNAKSVEAREMNAIVEEEGDNWMTPIIKCLKEGIWLENKNEARALRMKIGQYMMKEGILFKKSHLSPMLRCVGPLQASYIIREVHEGACEMHAGAQSVVAKIMRQGDYWPSMHRDTKEVVDKYDSYQIHGPIPEGPGRFKFIIVAIDYFTKWMEAKPLAKTTGKEVKKFVWENIVCRSEAVIPTEIGMPTYRTIQWNEVQNEEEMRLNLDLIQERRETAAIREAKYKKKVEQYYNKWVRPVSFRVGDFVYQRNEASRIENQGKLGPNWEGPYRVIEAYDNGSYKLCTMNDREVPRTWHAINLRNYFM
ncbi:reverse transcriptase domain-containing protein [Tanacetum coccineum]|uniref:Reverse transcriptase domain-containing protein n=1 Tax=Tanacetum coccineum TaxID=301880 RepID=A0ABQ4ZDF1_9ASTR